MGTASSNNILRILVSVLTLISLSSWEEALIQTFLDRQAF